MGAIDQHVSRLDVRVHYAGGVERVQRYQEVAEEVLHLPLGQVIVLLLSIVIVVALSLLSARLSSFPQMDAAQPVGAALPSRRCR